jgi:UDPglucose 6-dehydrogenase
VKDLLYPDRVLIGSLPNQEGEAAAEVLRGIFTTWVDPSKILTVNVWSSELAKLVANAMLAQRISSINTISAICDRTGADIDEVALAVGVDNRIGNKFLKAGLGFGGSCFKKDILSLCYLSNSLHLPEVAEYWMSVLTVNDFQRNRFMQNVVNKLHGALYGKKITVLGFTFKQNTNDTRESPAVDVIKELLQERPKEIAIFDPGCTPAEIRRKITSLKSNSGTPSLKPEGPVEAYAKAYDACKASSAILILTPWKQFAYPPQPIKEITMKPLVDPLLSLKACMTSDLSEMALMELEDDLIQRYGFQDPLQRLKREPSCPENCQICVDSCNIKGEKSVDNIEWKLVAAGMKEPKWIFDGRNMVDCKEMAKLGFRVESLGKGIHI